MTEKLTPLEQAVIECGARSSTARVTGQAEEVLFVIMGSGALRLGSERYALEPEAGAYVAPGSAYALDNTGSEPLRIVSVRIHDPVPSDGNGRVQVVVRRLADVEEQAATTERWFRVLADPRTGLRSATQFVGYIPPARAPDHFHTYDEVIYVVDGEGTFQAAGGARRPIGAGSCIELPARTVHCLENTGPDTMRLIAVFRPAGSPAYAYYPDGTPAYPGTPPLMS